MIEVKEAIKSKERTGDLRARWYWHVERNKSFYQGLAINSLGIAIVLLIMEFVLVRDHTDIMTGALNTNIFNSATMIGANPEALPRVVTLNQKPISGFACAIVVYPGDEFQVSVDASCDVSQLEYWLRLNEGGVEVISVESDNAGRALIDLKYHGSGQNMTTLGYRCDISGSITLIDGNSMYNFRLILILSVLAIVCFILSVSQRLFRRQAEQESYGQ